MQSRAQAPVARISEAASGREAVALGLAPEHLNFAVHLPVSAGKTDAQIQQFTGLETISDLQAQASVADIQGQGLIVGQFGGHHSQALSQPGLAAAAQHGRGGQQPIQGERSAGRDQELLVAYRAAAFYFELERMFFDGNPQAVTRTYFTGDTKGQQISLNL